MNVSIFGHVITNLILFHDTRVGLAKSSSSFLTTSPKHTPSAENICKHGSVLLQTNTLSLPSDVSSPIDVNILYHVCIYAPSTCHSNHRDVIFHTNRPEIFDGINRMSSFPTRFNLFERCKKCFTAST